MSPARPARLALLLTAALLGACTTTAHYGSDRIARKDPLEKFNRKVYKADRALDKAILRPVAVAYTKVVPEAGRRGIHNFFNNVEEPRNFVNAVLQGKPKMALQTLARFIINTTLGVGGFADHATGFGLPEHRKDFGETFGVWGIGSGPYLVLPVLGPSTLRDATGRGVAFAGGDPFDYAIGRLHLRWYVEYPGITAPRLLDTRAELLDTADKLLNGSADEYATVRSAYLQSRQSDLYDGNPPDEDAADSPADMATPAPAVPPPPKPLPDAPRNVDPGAPQPAPTGASAFNIDPGASQVAGASVQARNLDPGAPRPAFAPASSAPALNIDPGPPAAARPALDQSRSQ